MAYPLIVRPEAESDIDAAAEIDNIMAAIKAGIITKTTKAELEKAEAERDRLQTELAAAIPALNKVVDVLPRAVDRYRKLVENLENIPQRKVARARTQIKHLVGGEIKLIPSENNNYLEAELKATTKD
jgi:hypothetical protein